ncbi:hypothetical protein BDR06DRAFT_966985 [Suillus hirtellus]|nr:hypothetical protein BDR06DRAFT_966985 [Suillus hirtellus]
MEIQVPKSLIQIKIFMKDYIDDLLQLYDKGIIIRTSKYLEGQKEGFCSCCLILQYQLKNEDEMEYDKFPRQDGQQHQKHAKECNGVGTDIHLKIKHQQSVISGLIFVIQVLWLPDIGGNDPSDV